MNFLRKILDILFPPSHIEQDMIALSVTGDLPTALPVPHDDMYAALVYRHPTVRASVRILKTKHNSIIAECFAKILHDHLGELLRDVEPFSHYQKIIFVPLPITKKRLHERGFNQTELIAQKLYVKDLERYSVKKILKKIRETSKQAVSVSKTKRVQNIKGCFACKKKNLAHDRDTLYVVIDDVITTGATMKEAMQTLARAHYRPVIGLALAH